MIHTWPTGATGPVRDALDATTVTLNPDSIFSVSHTFYPSPPLRSTVYGQIAVGYYSN